MHIDTKQMDEILKTLGNKKARFIAETLANNKSFAFLQMKKMFNIEINKDTNGFVYYHKKLKTLKIIVKDPISNTYHLSRIGVRYLELINNFKLQCMKYDLTDADKDGKIELKIRGREI